MIYTKTASFAFAIMLLAGCNKEATGQVAAVVNGEEITLQEINAELGGAQVPDGVDKKILRQGALQRIIERRLLAEISKQDGLDKTQDYLLRERQLRDALLVQLLGQKTERSLKVPDDAAITKYIAENAATFADRKILTIDRIQFALPQQIDRLKSLENDHSMEAVAARLKLLGIDFRRDTTQLDSAQLGQPRLQQIRALPSGEPFVVPENGLVTVGVIIGEKATPLSGSDARLLAVQAMRNQQLQESLQQRMKRARTAADIKYQNNFAPAANPDAAASQTKGAVKR